MNPLEFTTDHYNEEEHQSISYYEYITLGWILLGEPFANKDLLDLDYRWGKSMQNIAKELI